MRAPAQMQIPFLFVTLSQGGWMEGIIQKEALFQDTHFKKGSVAFVATGGGTLLKINMPGKRMWKKGSRSDLPFISLSFAFAFFLILWGNERQHFSRQKHLVSLRTLYVAICSNWLIDVDRLCQYRNAIFKKSKWILLSRVSQRTEYNLFKLIF